MDLTEIVGTEAFHALPDAEKMKAMRQLFPGFENLPPEEQAKGLAELGKYNPANQKKPEIPSPMGTLPTIPNDPMSESLGMFAPENIPGNIPSPAGPLGQIGRGMVEQLPIAGMVLGGTTGAALGGPLGPLSGPAGGMLGAGAATGLRNILRNVGLGEKPPSLEPWKETGQEMMGAGLAEAGGPLLGKIAGKITSPFAAGLERAMSADPVIREAQRLVGQGVPISPDVIYPSKVGRVADWVISNVWPANSIMASQRKQVFNMTVKIRDEFAAEYGAGATSKKMVDKFYDDFVAMAGGPEATILLPKAMDFIRKSLDKPFAQSASGKSGAFWLKDAPTMLEEHTLTGANTVQAIRDMLATISPKSVRGADATARNKIISLVKEDLAAHDVQMGTDLVESLKAASDISWLKKRVAPIENLLNRSIAKKQPGVLGEIDLFDPIAFVNNYSKLRPHWLEDSRFTANDIKILDAFANKMRAVSPDVLAHEAMRKAPPALSGWGLLQAPVGTPIGVGVGAYKFPYLVIPTVGTTTALANSLMSPSGILRKFLTTGFAPPTMASKVGLMAGMEEVLKNAEPNR